MINSEFVIFFFCTIKTDTYIDIEVGKKLAPFLIYQHTICLEIERGNYFRQEQSIGFFNKLAEERFSRKKRFSSMKNKHKIPDLMFQTMLPRSMQYRFHYFIAHNFRLSSISTVTHIVHIAITTIKITPARNL